MIPIASTTLDPIPFDVVAFDLDGTLADTGPDLAAALNHALVRLGRREVPADEVRHLIGHGARALLRRGLATTGEASEPLVEAGLVERDADAIRVTTPGWYVVRAIAMVFDRYLQGDRGRDRFSRIL